jgi:hypothetical protein
MTAIEIQLSLIRDHIANRHARRAEPSCPVCAAVGDSKP